MAVTFTITVKGEEEPDLTVEVPDGFEKNIGGIGDYPIPFKVTNILDRAVTISSFEFDIQGAAKDKLSAAVLLDNFVINPGASIDNTLTITANAPIMVGEEATIAVTGRE